MTKHEYSVVGFNQFSYIEFRDSPVYDGFVIDSGVNSFQDISCGILGMDDKSSHDLLKYTIILKMPNNADFRYVVISEVMIFST